MKVAYLVNQYPKVSHSFIRREILALEQQSFEILRIALRGWDAAFIDVDDQRERQQTQYVLDEGLKRLIMPVLLSMWRSPVRFICAFRLALTMTRGSDRSWPYHFVYLAEACHITALIRRSGVQHLHAHFGTNPAEVAMLVNALCGVPYSFTAHGMDEVDRARALGLDQKVGRAAFAVAVSAFGRSQLLRWVDRQHWHKVRVVHCGLDRAFYGTSPVAFSDVARFVCVGRLSSEKGQLLLLEAAAVLARAGVDFELVLAGDGEMRPEIESAIAEYGLGLRVRVTGWISSAQVRAEIESARALVLPSLMEGLPVVIMEAMALRRPVLATYIGGIPELVIPGETGWLFPAGSVEELAAAMRACLRTPADALIRMGVAGRERALARHDVEREAARLAQLFRNSACAPGGAGAAS